MDKSITASPTKSSEMRRDKDRGRKKGEHHKDEDEEGAEAEKRKGRCGRLKKADLPRAAGGTKPGRR